MYRVRGDRLEENKVLETHTLTQWCLQGLLGAISLLTLANLMVVNAFS